MKIVFRPTQTLCGPKMLAQPRKSMIFGNRMASHYAPAFIEYCRGTPLEEISMIMGIPEGTLRSRASEEKWNQLRDSLPARLGMDLAVEPQGREKAQAQAMLMQKNREENYALWCKLRGEAAGVIEDLCAGKLKFTRYFHNRGSVVEHVCEPTMADRTALANYLQMIAMGTYAALGDRGATTGAKDGADAFRDATQAPAITIVLPGVISAPREDRTEVQVAPGLVAVTHRNVVDAEVVSETSSKT